MKWVDSKKKMLLVILAVAIVAMMFLPMLRVQADADTSVFYMPAKFFALHEFSPAQYYYIGLLSLLVAVFMGMRGNDKVVTFVLIAAALCLTAPISSIAHPGGYTTTTDANGVRRILYGIYLYNIPLLVLWLVTWLAMMAVALMVREGDCAQSEVTPKRLIIWLAVNLAICIVAIVVARQSMNSIVLWLLTALLALGWPALANRIFSGLRMR